MKLIRRKPTPDQPPPEGSMEWMDLQRRRHARLDASKQHVHDAHFWFEELRDEYDLRNFDDKYLIAAAQHPLPHLLDGMDPRLKDDPAWAESFELARRKHLVDFFAAPDDQLPAQVRAHLLAHYEEYDLMPPDLRKHNGGPGEWRIRGNFNNWGAWITLREFLTVEGSARRELGERQRQLPQRMRALPPPEKVVEAD